jgi:hypothetical protein
MFPLTYAPSVRQFVQIAFLKPHSDENNIRQASTKKGHDAHQYSALKNAIGGLRRPRVLTSL